MSTITSNVAFERIPVAALLLEVDGRVIVANAAAERMFGLHATELAGRLLGELFTGNGELQKMFDSSRPGERVYELQFGQRQSAECVMSAIEAEGRPVYQLFAIDITARKQAEATERARADAEQKSSATQRLDSLGIIAGGVAHDFNNLLFGVLAESSAAREDPTLPEATRDALRRIEAGAQRMAHLTRQMLAYAGRGRFVVQQLDPDELLGEVSEALTRMVRPGVKLVLTAGEGAVVVEADGGLLRQVMSNLVSNASDAGGTHIKVTSRVVLHNSEPWWQLEVSDDGVGMTPDILAKIFEPFFSTRSERHGLGLSAVHGIMRRLGGDVEVDSTPGHGARFAVRLPVIVGARIERRRELSAAAPAAKLAGIRVLVADDEPSVRATVRRLLERRGAAVTIAVDGSDAEKQIRSAAFGLIILDVVMPGRSGYEVLASARAAHPRCPIILMSGYSERTRGEGGDEEPDAFLEKPFTARVLDDAIDKVMLNRAR
ncbi:hypothetical protein BH11MYX3_BH11MYX3_11050 [soil metagenome]